MKLCTRCSQDKTIINFNKSSSTKDGLQNYCRDCSREASQALRTKKQEYVRRLLKQSGCVDCGFSDWRVLEFDHRPGTDKKVCVGTLTSSYGSMKLLKEEIEKCDIVCSNCHTLRTYDRNDSWRFK